MKFLLKIIDRLLFEKVDKSKNGKSANEKIFDGKKGLVDFEMNKEYKSKEFILWLPMNKDFFGFKGYENAPLNIFEKILDQNSKERPLINILKKKYEGQIKIDDEQGQRYIVLRDIGKNNKYTLRIFSNGLYRFEFHNEITYDNFLFEIKKLFDTASIKYINIEKNNTDEKSKKLMKNKTINLEDYNGILTYYQIEILSNGLYDENIFPSYYFANSNNKINKNEFEKTISLENVFKSITLVCNKTEESTNIFTFEPISSSRKSYKVKGSDNLEKLIIAMEQFIRVANTFSLEHYKRGLDFCLKELSRLGTMKSFNQDETTKSFLPPSLNEISSSIASLESYQTMIFEKLPIIEYLSELLTGLSKLVDKDNDVKKSLDEALRQFKRRIFVIKRYFQNVEDSLNIENQKNIQYELSEIRKYNEINSEMVVNDTLNYQQDMDTKEQARLNRLMYLITLIAVLFTVASPIISYIISDECNHITTIINNMNSTDIWTIIIFIFISLFVGTYIVKYKKNTNQEIFSRHIFENANPYSSYATKENNKRFNEYIRMLEKNFGEGIQKIPSLLNPEQCIECIKFDSFQEKFPTFKIYKFSFYSKEEKGNKYILHMDIEFDFHRQITTIINIRLVVLRNQNNELILTDIHNNAEKIKRKFYDVIMKNNDDIVVCQTNSNK